MSDLNRMHRLGRNVLNARLFTDLLKDHQEASEALDETKGPENKARSVRIRFLRATALLIDFIKFTKIASLKCLEIKEKYHQEYIVAGNLEALMNKTMPELVNYNQYFCFDLLYSRNSIIDERAQKILKKETTHRTDSDLAVLNAIFEKLSYMQDLNRLNKCMLDKFLKVCWLEEYEPLRVVVAQCQHPRYFYMVLTGSMLCVHKSSDYAKSEIICVIDKGQSFGNLPLQTQSLHTTSFISDTFVQLLVIQDSDFTELYMKDPLPEQDLSNNQRPTPVEHNADFIKDFLRNNSFFKNWPVDLLTQNSSVIKRIHYPPNRVILNDSHQSSYIFVVKSGRLSVWLAKISTNENKTKSIAKKNETAQYFTRNLALEQHHVLFAKKYSSLSNLPNQINKLKDMETRVKLKEILSHLGKHKEDDFEEVVVKPEKFHDYFGVTCKNVKWSPISTVYQYSECNQDLKETIKLPKIKVRRFSAKSDGKNTITSCMSKQELKKIFGNEDFGENDEKKILMQKLYAGEVFGLQDILFDCQPSMELLSDGCDCILISKEYFIMNSSIKYLTWLKDKILPFPRMEDIRDNYWSNFKRFMAIKMAGSITTETHIMPRITKSD